MKKIVALFLTIISISVNCQIPFDTLTINAKHITKINKPLTAAIERHIKLSKAKKNGFCVMIAIFPEIGSMQIPQPIIDSLYSHNDLDTEYSNDTVLPTYNFSIILASKTLHTEGWFYISSKNIFYCKYKNYDVFICSSLNLVFESNNEMLHFTMRLRNTENAYVEYPYRFYTRYAMWNNRYLTEIRYKDLINPPWTGARDEFE